ncbi:hypothetical protein [Mesorhizobium sp. M0019]|uniref:hypothetical protein n=1 Tax=Mesorhizobium sp. M0019 TaxID=2956845 RepID=UPI0033399C61
MSDTKAFEELTEPPPPRFSPIAPLTQGFDYSRLCVHTNNFGTIGKNLSRPECVLYEADGIWISDSRGGVARLGDDGSPTLLGSGNQVPNGFSRQSNGSFIVAGLEDGALHSIAPGGTAIRLLDAIDGKPLGAQ